MKSNNHKNYSPNYTNQSELKVGQIRRLVDMELRNDSRLVLITSINRADDSAEVVLVNNMTEIATPRDILLATQQTSAPFELVLLPDFTTHVWKQQLESSPIFGNLDMNKIKILLKIKNDFKFEFDNLNILNQFENRGHYVPEFADHVWLFRGKEIDALNALGHVFDILASNQRFYEIWRHSNEDTKLIDIILNNNLDLSLIDNFLSIDSIRLELV